MKSKIRVEAEATSFTFVMLHSVAYHSLQEAGLTEKGRLANCLTAMLFSAFVIEAYLNHIGPSEFPDWETLELKKTPREKLDSLLQHRRCNCDFRSRPFHTFGRIFAFRKLMVHGKTEHLVVNRVQHGTLGARPALPKTVWEREISLHNAEMFFKDSGAMIRALHPLFGYKSEPFGTEWRGSWSVTPI